jgi:hypothetical protein
VRRKPRLPRKKPKLAPLIPQTEIISVKPAQILSTQEMFEQPKTQVQNKKIELKLPETVLNKEDEKG